MSEIIDEVPPEGGPWREVLFHAATQRYIAVHENGRRIVWSEDGRTWFAFAGCS